MSHTLTRHFNGIQFSCKPAKNGVWYIRWSEDRRSKRHSTGQRTASAADAYMNEWLKLDATPATLLTCADVWDIKYGHLEASHRYAIAGRNLMASFGEKRPGDISQVLENRYKRERGVAMSTIRLELSLLRASWAEAVRRRLLSVDDLPVLDPLPALAPPRDRWLRDPEIEQLLETAQSNRRVLAFLHIALETGARRTAIQDLTWDQVDWDTGVIHFLPEGQAQSRKRRASVPISKTLRPELDRMFADKVDEFVIGEGTHINKALAHVARKAGLKGVTPHVMRHTAATRMARKGVPLWLIAKVLGNTVDQVEQVYAKHTPDMLVDAVNAISGEAA